MSNKEILLEMVDTLSEEKLLMVISYVSQFKDSDNLKSYGALSNYADADKIPLEKDAFLNAMVMKHEND